MFPVAEPLFADIVRHTRAFILSRLEEDAIRLRPDIPRVRTPLTPLAEKLLRVLLFRFANVLTGLCNPAIATLAAAAGCSESSVKRLLPELQRIEYLSWRPGKRLYTRAGWRVVRSSHHYQPLYPRRHLAALRRMLMQIYHGRHAPLIQIVVALFTPPTDEAKATTQIIDTLAADLRPSPARTAPSAAPTQDTDDPAQAPPGVTGSVEIGGRGSLVTHPSWEACSRASGRPWRSASKVGVKRPSAGPPGCSEPLPINGSGREHHIEQPKLA